MLVEMTTGIVSASFVANPGDVVDFDDADARRLIERGSAVLYTGDDDEEAQDDGPQEPDPLLAGLKSKAKKPKKASK